MPLASGGVNRHSARRRPPAPRSWRDLPRAGPTE